MVFCRKCGKENDDDADYCNSCGTSLKTMKRRKASDECFGENSSDDECVGLPYGIPRQADFPGSASYSSWVF